MYHFWKSVLELESRAEVNDLDNWPLSLELNHDVLQFEVAVNKSSSIYECYSLANFYHQLLEMPPTY